MPRLKRQVTEQSIGAILSTHHRSPAHSVVSAFTLLFPASLLGLYGHFTSTLGCVVVSIILLLGWLAYVVVLSHEALHQHEAGLVHRGLLDNTRIALADLRDYLVTRHVNDPAAITIRTTTGIHWRTDLNWSNRSIIEAWVEERLVVARPDRNRFTMAGVRGAALGRSVGAKLAQLIRRGRGGSA